MMLFATVVSLSKEFFTHIAPVDPAVLIGNARKGVRLVGFAALIFWASYLIQV